MGDWSTAPPRAAGARSLSIASQAARPSSTREDPALPPPQRFLFLAIDVLTLRTPETIKVI